MPIDDVAAVRRAMVLRYAVGVAISIAVSQGFGWTLSYMVPILVVMLLASAQTPLSFWNGIRVVLVVSFAMLFGLATTVLLLPYPIVAVLVIALVMFSIFYVATAPGSALTALMLLIAVTVLPVVGQISLPAVELVASSLGLAAAAAVLVQWVAFAIVPPPVGGLDVVETAPAEAPSREARLYAAVRTTAVILPLQMAYLIFGWTSLVVLLMAALLAQQADAQAGIAGAKGLVVANLIGGVTAIVAYNLLVAVPSFLFLVVLLFAIALVFAEQIFGDAPSAKLYASAFSTALILIGSSVSPFGDDAGAKFQQRLIQVMLAGMWVAGAFLLFPPRPRAPEPELA